MLQSLPAAAAAGLLLLPVPRHGTSLRPTILMCSVYGSTAEFSTTNTPGVFFVRKHSRIQYKEHTRIVPNVVASDGLRVERLISHTPLWASSRCRQLFLIDPPGKIFNEPIKMEHQHTGHLPRSLVPSERRQLRGDVRCVGVPSLLLRSLPCAVCAVDE